MNLVTSKNVQYNNFLDEEVNKNLFEYATQIADRFKTSAVLSYSDRYPDWRRSKDVSRKNFGPYYELLKNAISAKYREVCDTLQIEPLEEYKVEAHLTAHNDGDYFKAHYDSGTKETNNRTITFVYYFNKEPKQFSGGELVLHAAERIAVEPINNKIIFFDPMCRHEVRTVSCPDGAFENSRFSLNGWILKQE